MQEDSGDDDTYLYVPKLIDLTMVQGHHLSCFFWGPRGTPFRFSLSATERGLGVFHILHLLGRGSFSYVTTCIGAIQAKLEDHGLQEAGIEATYED